MKERPILFSAPMVKAILDGRKTMTRRVVKLRHGADVVVVNGQVLKPASVDYAGYVDCPYGQPGDRLWVRESWRIGAWDENEGDIAIDYCDGPDKRWRTTGDDPDGAYFNDLWIQSCDELKRKGIKPDENGKYHWLPGESPLRWRPSIHMPRMFSRLTLEITATRVERLHDITEADALAEGSYLDRCACMPRTNDRTPMDAAFNLRECHIHGAEFSWLWKSINGAWSWNANPWVWVVEFAVIQRNDGD